MEEALRRTMRQIEAAATAEQPYESTDLHWAALAGLGSKYLAIGSPASLGVVACGAAATSIVACHQLLFGALEVRSCGGQSGDELERAFACDIVCLPDCQDFDPLWIAEATHINLCMSQSPSAASTELLNSLHATTELLPTAQQRSHGTLAEVITGRVSGRVGEELTLLLHRAGSPPA